MHTSARVKKQIGHHAGTVLLRLSFWIKLNVKKGRAPCTSIGMQTIADECGLSFFQARRTVGRLRREGYIRSEQHLFPTKDGSVNLNSYRLTVKAEELISGSFEQTTFGSLEPCNQGGEEPHTGTHETTEASTPEHNGSGSLYSTNEKAIENTDEKVPQPLSGSSAQAPIIPPVDLHPSPQSPPSQKSEASMSHSVHDVQGMLAAKKKLHKPDSGLALAQVWQIGMKAHIPNAIVAVTITDMAKLKLFAKHCEPGTAEAVLQFTLAEWIAFTKFCEQEAGAFKTPGTPTVPFLVKFGQLAVTFYLQKEKKPAMATPSVNPKPVATQLIAAQEPAPPTVTLDEVLAPFDHDAALKD